MSGFAGDGGPPPPPGSGGGGKFDPQYGFSHTVLKERDGKKQQFQQRVKLWYVPPSGKDRPLVMLDPSGPRFAVRIHRFIGPDGRKGSMVRAIPKEARGDPVAQALGKDGTWFWCLTCIDRGKFIPKEGKNKGKVYTNFRKLVLVTSQQYNDMVALEEKDPEGWRGRTFDVSRSSDTKSYKIGTQWYPTGKMSDDEMLEMFAEAAAHVGVPVAEYVKPFDYNAILKAPTYEEALKIAQAIEGAAAASDEAAEGVNVPTGDEETVQY